MKTKSKFSGVKLDGWGVRGNSICCGDNAFTSRRPGGGYEAWGYDCEYLGVFTTVEDAVTAINQS